MNIHFTDTALQWFKEEMHLTTGDFVRFYVRYGGASPIQEGFSLGFNKEEPIEVGIKEIHDGVVFYVEEKDLWYFKNYDLYVDYDQRADGPVYEYK